MITLCALFSINSRLEKNAPYFRFRNHRECKMIGLFQDSNRNLIQYIFQDRARSPCEQSFYAFCFSCSSFFSNINRKLFHVFEWMPVCSTKNAAAYISMKSNKLILYQKKNVVSLKKKNAAMYGEFELSFMTNERRQRREQGACKCEKSEYRFH